MSWSRVLLEKLLFSPETSHPVWKGKAEVPEEEFCTGMLPSSYISHGRACNVTELWRKVNEELCLLQYNAV
jgi:hypothetical protein